MQATKTLINSVIINISSQIVLIVLDDTKYSIKNTKYVNSDWFSSSYSNVNLSVYFQIAYDRRFNARPI